MGAQLGSKGPMADINVTPLIDVVLVLLVVFMVITPMLQSGLPVDLPKASQTTTVNDVGQHIVVSVSVAEECKKFPCQKPAQWWVEQERVEFDDEGKAVAGDLLQQINFAFRANPERTVLIKADARLAYHQVREVMDVLAENGMTSIFVSAAKEE